MPSIGHMELVIVLVIALLVLGPRKLPEAGRGIGRGLREFKDELLGRGEPEPRAVERTSGRATTSDPPVSAVGGAQHAAPAGTADRTERSQRTTTRA